MSDIMDSGSSKEALETGVGMFGSKIRGRAKNFFGQSAQADLAVAHDRKVTGQMMKGVIGQFGMKNMMKGDAFFDAAAKDVQQQLKEARDEAIRARAAGDMDSYRRALQRKAELERLAQNAKIAKESGMANLWVGLATAFATVLGTIAGGPIGAAIGGAVTGFIGGKIKEAVAPDQSSLA